MKIDRRYFNVIFSSLIALIMSFCMSFFMLLINIGFSKIFFNAWMKSFGLGFIIALPISIIFIPIIRTGLEKIFEKK